MHLGVMIEGQEDLNWDRWRRLVRATEDLGFESLWRSDHFFSLMGRPERDALETFISFVMAAEMTERIRFGPLVASCTFRHPSLVARMAAQIDQLSGGRFVLGLGAGWNVPEHEAFGLPFPSIRERMDRLEESIEVVKALWGDGPVSYEGEYYQLEDAQCFPKPAQSPTPLIVGGGGERRTLRIVAKHATEWNAIGVNVERYLHKKAVLEEHCEAVGRDPSTIVHSQMSTYLLGRDEAELTAHLQRVATTVPNLAMQLETEGQEAVLDGLRERGWLIGSPAEMVEELGRREEAGISRYMFQHLAVDDYDTLELLASEVLPQVQR